MGDETNGAFVRITNREVYEKLALLEKTVLHIDMRMDAILSESVALNKRVRALELKVYAVLAGFSTALSAGGLWLFSHL